MNRKLKIFFSVSFIPLIYFIGLIKNENLFIENFYSNSLYIFISEKLRILNYWTDVPVGDLIYILLFFFVFIIEHNENQRKRDCGEDKICCILFREKNELIESQTEI